jgi:hypothetical protein
VSSVPLLIFAVSGIEHANYSSSGFGEAASFLIANSTVKEPILVASDPDGEGMMISQIALREPRPGHFVLRANKLLANMSWTGAEYRLRYQTPEELMEFLDSGPLRIVVDDGSGGSKVLRDHQRLLRKTIQTYGERWKEIAQFPVDRAGTRQPEGIRIYRLLDPLSSHPTTIQADMQRMLGTTLEAHQ